MTDVSLPHLLLAFTVQIRKPTPDVVHNYFKLIPGATFDTKANEAHRRGTYDKCCHFSVVPVPFDENVTNKILVNVH